VSKTGLFPHFRLNQLSLFCAALALACAAPARAQKADPNDPQNVEKGKQLLAAAVEARGGAAYLNFKTLTATGQYTPFEQGMSTVPIPFNDYIVYPDRERVEFGRNRKMKDRRIQVNTGARGWVYDGDAQTLKDQDEKQVKSFQEGLETDLDRILREAWRQPGVEVRFYGREETRPGERADVVSIKLRENLTAHLMLHPHTRLPMSLSYERDGEQGVVRHEYRFNQYVTYEGVKFPNIVDYYRNGIQASRVNYQEIKLNQPIPDALFAKPESAKAIK
jgi:hypothetical protein